MSRTDGQLVHIVTLQCKDADNAANCINALATYGRPDAEAFGCLAYEFGLKEGTQDTVHIVERWTDWADLDRLLTEKVVPALPLYNQMLLRPFDPGSDTLRIRLA
jgi:quinol monooxygenase YgiN